MDWLNIDILLLLEDQRFLIAESTERGVWITLMKYCAVAENGGVIPNAATYKDRLWQQVVGVTRSEIKTGAGADRLWWFDGDHLIIWGYPAMQEAKVKQSRANGQGGGRPSQKPSQKPSQEPRQEPNQEPRDKPRRKPRQTMVGYPVGFSPPHTPPLVTRKTRKSPPVAPHPGGFPTTTTLSFFPDISEEDFDQYGPGPPNSPIGQHPSWEQYVTDAPSGMRFDAWLEVKDHPLFEKYLDQAEDGAEFEKWLADETKKTTKMGIPSTVAMEA